MRKIVDKETNRVAFGSYNEPLELNFEDYRLVSFFNKKYSKSKTLKNLKKFNYYSFVNHDKVVSIGIVKLGFINNIFAYVHTREEGIIFNEQINPLGVNKVIYLGDNYNFKVDYVSKNTQIYINKTGDGLIDMNINFKNQFKWATIYWARSTFLSNERFTIKNIKGERIRRKWQRKWKFSRI